jgi:MtN3 and saliva related transmembrane protein
MKAITLTDMVGWASAAVLLATIGRQVYSQCKSKAIYSSLLHNWVFLLSNAAMIVTAVVGELINISNRKRQGQ